MGRKLVMRLKEHRRAVIMDDNKNEIAVHTNNTRHSIQRDSTKVLNHEQNWLKRRTKEALIIREETRSMKLYSRLILSPIWSTLNSTPNEVITIISLIIMNTPST